MSIQIVIGNCDVNHQPYVVKHQPYVAKHKDEVVSSPINQFFNTIMTAISFKTDDTPILPIHNKDTDSLNNSKKNSKNHSKNHSKVMPVKDNDFMYMDCMDSMV